MNENMKDKLRNKAKEAQEEERNNQLHYELKAEQLKNTELYLRAVKELQELKFLQNSMAAKAQENINAVNAAGISWMRSVEGIYHKVQLAHKDIVHLTEHNEQIHSDLFELRDNLFEFAQDLEEHMDGRLTEFDENAKFRTEQYNANADNRESRFNALADKRESGLNSIIDKHKLYLKDYDIKLKDYDHNLSSTIQEQNSNMKEFWKDFLREGENHYKGLENLGKNIVHKMKEERTYFKEEYGKVSNEISEDIRSGVSKYKDVYHQLQLKEQELQGKNLLSDLEHFKKNMKLDKQYQEKRHRLDEREHQLDLNHLKHLDAQEAQSIRDEEKYLRELEREEKNSQRAEEKRIQQMKKDKRDYEAGNIPKWKWNKMYPDGLPYGL